MHAPYTPHNVELLPALSYIVKMIDCEGCFFWPEPFTGKPNLSILDEPKFTKTNFANDLYKLTALGTSGPV